MEYDSLIDQFVRAGQEQVFRYWSELDSSQQAALAAQAAEIDLAEVHLLVERLVRPGNASELDLKGLKPAPFIAVPEHGGDQVAWAEARLAGEKALRAGKVAAFTVAGGQGTRLGFDGPKGTFPVTPVRNKPLFQVFAEKLRAAQKRYGCELAWFIMTSHANHAATLQFFDQHRFFGLRAEQVHFFRQGRMPAVDFDGRILLEQKDAIALSPDGHGGALRALVRSGAVDTMERSGNEVLSYFQVDNPLVQCIDPEFIGFHVLRGSEMSSRALPKAYEKEKIGVFCQQKGRLIVVEYSDLPDDFAAMKNQAGELVFRAGSIAIHLLSTRFIRRMGEGTGGVVLPFHRADKKIAVVDDAGNTTKPDQANGVKFELFVFDALPFARNPVVAETRRWEQFSPVKNAQGVDSPQTCRDDQLKLFTHWMHAAGVPVPVDESGKPRIAIEVSPLFATDADSFSASWAKLDPPPELKDGLVLG